MRWLGVIVAILVLAAVIVIVLVAAGGGGSEDSSTPLGRPGEEQRQTAGPGGQANPASPGRAAAYWSYDTLRRRIAGELVRVGRRRVRVEPDLVICSGRGRGIGRPARWARFTCTQTTFERWIGEDVTFEVLVLDERRWRIVNARVGPE